MERWYKAGLFMIFGVMIISVSLFESAWKLICGLALAVIFISVIVSVLVLCSPLVVMFDEQWLMMKHGIFRKDVRMDDIIRVRYYIMKQRVTGRYCRRSYIYSLILEIEYQGGRQELMEQVTEDEIEYCKNGEADKELFVLYDYIKELYPEKAKGYWKYCGI